MPDTNSNTQSKKKHTHLDETERVLIEQLLKEGKKKAEIARLLGRSQSTIYREIKRGTVTQIKDVNGYQRKVKVYYADAGQAFYKKNRQKNQPKGLGAFSQKFWEDLKQANEDNWFTGKNRRYNLKTFIVVYRRKNPLEKSLHTKQFTITSIQAIFLLSPSTY